MTIYPRVQPWIDTSKRYRLAKLRPEGVGTSQVESLSSYLTRLAASHWVSPTNLYMSLAAEVKENGARKLTSASRIDGYSKLSCEVSRTLNEMSPLNSDFSTLTLSEWGNVFAAHGCGLLRDRLAWCNECHSEDLVRHAQRYNRLLWCVRSVSVCPIHHQPLRETCPTCGAKQASVTASAQIGYCQQCGSDLVPMKLPEGGSSRIDEEAEWKSAACTELLSATQSGARFDRSTFLAQFRAFLERYRGSPKRMARSLNLPLDSIRSWVVRGHRPEIRFFLEVCYRLDIPPLRFFEPSGSLPINQPRVKKKIVNLRPPFLTKDDVRKAQGVISMILDAPDDIQRLQDVADAAELTVTQLKYHLADEYAAIVRRIFERRAREKRERDEDRIRRLERRALSLIRRGIYPSQRKILSTKAVRSSDMRIPLVKKALREIQDRFLAEHPEFQKDAKFMHHLRLSRRRMPSRREIANQLRLQSAEGRLR